MKDLHAEARLLLLCANSALDSSSRERILALIAAGVDWERLLALAARHGLGPIVYRSLNGIEPPAAPGLVVARLWVSFENAAQGNRRKATELIELLRLFEEHGIPSLPYKGPTLAVQLYGDVAFRQFGDLDLLVPARWLTRARELIEARGYESAFPLSRHWESVLLRNERHHSLAHYHAGKDVVVELHWRTDCSEFALPGIDESWWERRPRAPFEGESVRALTPEEYVYLLCMHGTRHHWMNLALVVDLAGMVRKHPELDWRRVIEMARAQGTLRLLTLGLALARRLLEAPLPEKVLERIEADATLSVMTRRTVRMLGLTDSPAPAQRERLAFELLWIRFWPPWLGYLLKLTLLPNMADWSRWDLPPVLSFVHYPLHLGRLIARHGLHPERKFFR